MYTTAAQILKDLPDFTDLSTLTIEIKNMSVKKMLLEVEINTLESKTVAYATEHLKIEGKTPSVAYIRDALRYGGIEGEIIPLRSELAGVTAELDFLKRKFTVFEQMLDIWRTLSANERRTAL